MRITLLSFHYAEYALSLAQALAKEHHVLLYLYKKNAVNELIFLPKESERLTIRYLSKLTHKSPKMFLDLVSLIREVRQFRPDLIHCQECFRDCLSLALPYLATFPFVLTIHDHKPHSGTDSQLKLRSRFHRYVLRRVADAVIVHGEIVKQETEALVPRLKGKVHAVPHGILGGDARPFQADWQEGLILFFGRINKYKGLRYFVEAIELLHQWGLHVKALVAGTGPELVSLRERIISNPAFILLEEYIPAESISALFKRAQIVVLPYTDATQSGVAALALSHARPIIASNVGSLSEMVRSGVNGLLVAPKDVIGLAKAIKQLLTNHNEAACMGESAHRLAQTEFSWENIAEKTTAVYEILFRSHRKKEQKEKNIP
jgi:glycosyltransferase involved in cell wall biosynthesis